MDSRILTGIKTSITNLTQKIISNRNAGVYSFPLHKIRKRNGKEREIVSPSLNFKQDNRQLLELLSLIVPTEIKKNNSVSVASVYSGIERKILQYRYLLEKGNYILKLDIKNAFSSTNKDLIVKNLIVLCNLEYDIASLIAEACTLNSILPQGFATSRLLYEVCAYNIDIHLQRLIGICKYFRYVDDILIFGHKKGINKHNLKQKLYQQLKDLTQYELNMDKFRMFTTPKQEVWFLSACIFHPNDKKINRRKIRINKKIRQKQRSYLYAGIKKGNKESLAIAKALDPLVRRDVLVL
jgi:hypothetical protein